MNKKIYTLLVLCSLIKIGNAQITLTKAANEPAIGDIERKKSFDTTATCPQNIGTGQVWNFSTCLTTNTTAMSSDLYVSPTSITGSGSYAGTTVADSTAGSSNKSYFKSTATQFELLGIKANTLSITFTNSAVMAVWPISSSYNNTDNIGGSISVGSLSGTFSGTVAVKGTGTGTLQLPGGVTYTNVLQVRSKQTLNGSFLFGFVTATVSITNFQYYDQSEKFPILSHQITSITTATASYNSTVTAVSINNNAYVGINENQTALSEFNIFPNPASDQISITLDNQSAEEVSVHILNNLGQVVKSLNLEKGPVNAPVYIRDLPSGMYYVKTNVGSKSTVKKLTIQ